MIRKTPLLPSVRTALQAGLLAAATLALATVVPAYAQTVSAPSKNAAAAAPQSPYHGDVVEDIIAQVNDQVISSSDYARAQQELDAQAKQRNMTQVDLDAQKSQLLRDLIDNQLLLSKGKQLGITGEAETVRQLDELRKQNHLDSMEALEKAAEEQGVSFADFKAGIQNRIITSQVIRDEVGRRINITQADEQQYYDEHKDQFTTPESVKLSEILVPTADPDNAAQVASAQTKADGLEAQLKSGKDFAALAKSSSGGSTAAQGGALGDYKRGALGKVLEDATFPLKAGEYTAPIRTKQGFVILKVEDHTASGQQPFSAVQPQVEDAVGMQKMNPALRQYLTRLREEAYIDVKPGYVDAGSSKNETRPIFSAYQPPQTKKKKKVDRTRFSGRGRTRVARSAPAAPPAAPASAIPPNTPSLADVPSGSGATPSTAPGTTPSGTPGTPASSSSSSSSRARPTQTASAKPLKPGKREKVRFGQAPRETLPPSDTREQDAGASAENGNGSNAETAQNNGSNAAGGNVAPGLQYENGESATEQQAVQKKVKTRFSQQGAKVKAAKIEKKRQAKIDPYPSPAADSQEIADKSVQAKPLGLEGDTSKKPPRPKAASKSRYSDEAGKKTDEQPPVQQNTNATVGYPDTAPPAAPAAAPPDAQPYQEPSPQRTPGTNPPVNTQTTPTGNGDPLGPPTPAPAQPQAPQR